MRLTESSGDNNSSNKPESESETEMQKCINAPKHLVPTSLLFGATRETLCSHIGSIGRSKPRR